MRLRCGQSSTPPFAEAVEKTRGCTLRLCQVPHVRPGYLLLMYIVLRTIPAADSAASRGWASTNLLGRHHLGPPPTLVSLFSGNTGGMVGVQGWWAPVPAPSSCARSTNSRIPHDDSPSGQRTQPRANTAYQLHHEQSNASNMTWVSPNRALPRTPPWNTQCTTSCQGFCNVPTWPSNRSHTQAYTVVTSAGARCTFGPVERGRLYCVSVSVRVGIHLVCLSPLGDRSVAATRLGPLSWRGSKNGSK
jgi:hypothetical protein